jgi:hypothetical protein
VAIEWADLVEKYGTTRFYEDGSVEIKIDRANVTSEGMLLKTVRNEACHVATHDVVVETGQDPHGCVGDVHKCRSTTWPTELFDLCSNPAIKSLSTNTTAKGSAAWWC